MFANYNKILPKLLLMPPPVEGVVQNLHFQDFICVVLNLFFQHHHPNS